MHSTPRRRPYIVTVHPDGRWWHIRVPELDVVTQAERLADARGQARDLIATVLEISPDRIRTILKRRSGLHHQWSDELRASVGAPAPDGRSSL